jgi:hypothetical protein
MQHMKKQATNMPTDQLLLHRAATAQSRRCVGYRAAMGDRHLELPRDRCMQNEVGGYCVAPPRMRSRRVSA